MIGHEARNDKIVFETPGEILENANVRWKRGRAPILLITIIHKDRRELAGKGNEKWKPKKEVEIMGIEAGVLTCFGNLQESQFHMSWMQ